VGLTSLCSSRGYHRRLWMDPHAVWVDLESSLVVVHSGPTMTASARRGAVWVEEPPPGTDLCRLAVRAPPRSRSMATRPPAKGPTVAPSSSSLRSSSLVTHRSPRFAWSCAAHEGESGSEEREWQMLGFSPERWF
jgi:hypothetical protein